MRNDVTMKFEIYEIENDKENSGENIRNNKVDNKVDNINLKFEIYECVRGGMQQTTPGAIDSFEYPRHESAKHLILQHNKSWYNKYYTHQGVALHDANDVITNTTQRVQCETDIDNYEIKIKFIQEVNK